MAAKIRLITRYKLENLRGVTPTVQHNTINNNAPVIGPQVAGNNRVPMSANLSISQLLELLADQMERTNEPPDPERTSFVGKLRKVAAEGVKVGATETVKEVVRYLVGLGLTGAP